RRKDDQRGQPCGQSRKVTSFRQRVNDTSGATEFSRNRHRRLELLRSDSLQWPVESGVGWLWLPSRHDRPPHVANHQRTSSRRIPKARHLRHSAQNRMDVRRAEYNYIIDVLNERKIILNRLREGLERLEQTADIQFKRIAQIQVDLDEMKNEWQKVNVP